LDIEAAMTLVFNASPLIVLAKSALIGSLVRLADQVIIPQAVADEVRGINFPNDPATFWLVENSTLIPPAEPPISPFVQAWDLGAGESAVISLTEKHPGATAVLDDLAARRCAQAMGLQVTGTLGLILLAKRKALIPSVTPALDAVVAAGLYVSNHHLSAIRTAAGE
jgi:predicted nucleic acid-binding protein